MLRPQAYADAVLPTQDQVSPLLTAVEASISKRLQHLIEVESGGDDAIKLELVICQFDVFHWFQWYAWTYDPRNADPNNAAAGGGSLPTWLPFDLFPRQVELVNWFYYILRLKEDGCLKKSRDIGFTWLAAAFAWHQYRFVPGFKTTFGSRKTEYVDKLGDPDSILEKVRILYQALPKWMLPPGFNQHRDDGHMLIVNPDNGAIIRGEGGEEMGRGGRSTLYFIDEAAKLEHAERVDAATSGNTDCRIWGSSINPQNENNLFQRKYTSFPADRVFRFHYSDDPRKTPEWAAKKRGSMSPENWAAEYEIDDSYTVEDICIPSSWVDSAKRLKALCEAKGIKLEPRVEGIAGGDVGGGKAQSVVVARFGPVVTIPKAWTDPDTIDTAFKMLDYCQELKLPQREDGYEPKVRTLRFDSIGVGFGVSAAMRRNPRPGLIVVGVNVGSEPTDTRWPDGEEANEKFLNLKAEGWWTTREQFKRTHEMVLWLEDKPGGHQHPVSDCISIPDEKAGSGAMMLCQQLSQVKWNRNERGKIVIESKASLTKRGIGSPDYADALVLTNAGTSKAEKWAAFAKVQV